MGHSFLLTAGLLLGQVQDVQIVSQPQQACGCGQSTVHYSSGGGFLARFRNWGSSNNHYTEERTLLSRFQQRWGFFRGGEQTETVRSWPSTPGNSGTLQAIPVSNPKTIQGPMITPIPPAEFLHRMPSKVSMSEPPLLETSKNGVQPASFQSKPAQSATPPAHVPAFQPAGQSAPALAAPLPASAFSKPGHEENYSWITGRVVILNNKSRVVEYAAPGSKDRFGGRLVLTGHKEIESLQDGDTVTVRGQVIPAQGGMHVYRVSSVEMIEREVR